MSGQVALECSAKAIEILRHAERRVEAARDAIGDALAALPYAELADLAYGDGARLLVDVRRGLRDAQAALALMDASKYQVGVLAQHLDAQTDRE